MLIINEASVRTQNDEVQRVSRLVSTEVLAEWFLEKACKPFHIPRSRVLPSDLICILYNTLSGQTGETESHSSKLIEPKEGLMGISPCWPPEAQVTTWTWEWHRRGQWALSLWDLMLSPGRQCQNGVNCSRRCQKTHAGWRTDDKAGLATGSWRNDKKPSV